MTLCNLLTISNNGNFFESKPEESPKDEGEEMDIDKEGGESNGNSGEESDDVDAPPAAKKSRKERKL